MNKRIVFIVGPTAVGKSEIAVALAKKINAEIISCDSMQIYKEMNILTSKPSITLRKKIPHYLIDLISPSKEYNVSDYNKEALKIIKKIFKKGKIPIFVGGTGLYVSVLIDGIFKGRAKNQRIRNKLYELSKSKGNRYIYNRLKKVDPEAAGKIHPNDKKRIIRALEVFESLGKPISLLQKQRKGLKDKYDIEVFCLNMKRSNLYKRIDQRVERMFENGLINEVKGLLRSRLIKTASYAIGIQELKGYFDGLYDLEETKRLIKRDTRHYAKRQLTWFRKDKRINWVNVGYNEKPVQTANKILSLVTGK